MIAETGGGCACGGVRYRVDAKLRAVVNCHCEPCRRITGHFLAATTTDVGSVVFISDDTLRWYDSTATVQYGFCGTCGSMLFWRASDRPDQISITAGTLDTPTGLTTSIALFGDIASDYHQLDETIETLPGDRQRPGSDGVGSDGV